MDKDYTKECWYCHSTIVHPYKHRPGWFYCKSCGATYTDVKKPGPPANKKVVQPWIAKLRGC